MTISKCTLADVPELAILFDQYRVFYKQESNLDSAINFLTARLQNNESIIFIAHDISKNIIGFTQLYPLFSSTKMKKLWLLNDLFVDKSFRKQGIAEMLINEAKKICVDTQARGLILQTAKDNKIANALYIKTNFSLDINYNYYSWEY